MLEEHFVCYLKFLEFSINKCFSNSLYPQPSGVGVEEHFEGAEEVLAENKKNTKKPM